MPEIVSDAALLERFATDREESAFDALVRRHGPRVERICRRILRDEHDAEDVFQATFLVLARKASAVSWRDSVSPWIDGVARRLALSARSGASRRRCRETRLATLAGGPVDDPGRLPERFHPTVEPRVEIERRDLRRVLDDELRRLPEKYRAPVVLCDLEGHTREEAARRLGWPSGSMSRRLDRARSMLRHRLIRRGVGLALVGLVAMATASLRPGIDRSGRISPVRPVMAAFRPLSDGGDGSGPVLASAARGADPAPDYARILAAARAATSAARRIEGCRPDRSAAAWDRLAIDMREAADDLERACERTDASAVVAAARRLEASCVRCHTAFRPDPARSDGPGSARLSPRPRPPGQAHLDPDRSRTALRPPGPGATGLPDAAATPSGVMLIASNEAMIGTVMREGPDPKVTVRGSAPRPGGDRWPPAC